MKSRVIGATCVCLSVAIAAAAAHGQEQSFEYGVPFRTVRAAVNAAYPGGELFSNAWVGAVAYEYRIAEREVTTTERLACVRAYTPHYTGNPEDPGLNGTWLRYDFAPGQYHVVAGAEQYAADMSWRMAARLCNWLHNGKVNEAWALESGEYDTSTFNDLSPFTDQLTHSPGSRFWIPTRDGWFKATQFDPDRFGPNLSGYWLYADGGNDPLVIGLPEEGGGRGAEIGLATSVSGLARPAASHRGRWERRPRWPAGGVIPCRAAGQRRWRDEGVEAGSRAASRLPALARCRRIWAWLPRRRGWAPGRMESYFWLDGGALRRGPRQTLSKVPNHGTIPQETR